MGDGDNPAPTGGGIDLIGLGLIQFGAVELALGIWMVVSPHSFYTALGPFGIRNDHYTRDAATFELALGAMLLVALRRRAWAGPLLALTALQFGLHAINHLNDIDAAHPRWVGYFDFFLLALGAIALALLARLALTAPRAPG